MNDKAKIELAARVLGNCAKQFRYYEDCHMAKNPPDNEKAAANHRMAQQCEDTIKDITTKDTTI